MPTTPAGPFLGLLQSPLLTGELNIFQRGSRLMENKSWYFENLFRCAVTARGADEENCLEGNGDALMLPFHISGVLMELIRYNIFRIKFLGRSTVYTINMDN